MTAAAIIGPEGRATLPVFALSNSEIQTYKRCRRKWYLAHYRKLRRKRDSATGALAIGTRVHAALEAYYTDGQDPVSVHSELLGRDRQALLYEGRDVTELESEGDLGRIMLEGYLEWLEETGADTDWRVISAEQQMSVPLFNGEVELKAKLDMRVERLTDNVRLFVDHKTVGNFADWSRKAYMDEQLLTYHVIEMCQTDEAERCDGGVYNMLRKVKRTATARPPFYERLEVRHNRLFLESFWKRLHGEIIEIRRLAWQLDSGADHMQVAYPTPSNNCHWDCDFYPVCPLIDDGSAAEQMLDELYETHDPYERYSKEVT